jgi:hypothetical protein
MNTRFERLADLATYFAIALVWIVVALQLAAGSGTAESDGAGASEGIIELPGTVDTTVLPTGHANDGSDFDATVDACGPVEIEAAVDAVSTMLDGPSGTPTPAPAVLTLRAALPGIAVGNPVTIRPLASTEFCPASAATDRRPDEQHRDQGYARLRTDYLVAAGRSPRLPGEARGGCVAALTRRRLSARLLLRGFARHYPRSSRQRLSGLSTSGGCARSRSTRSRRSQLRVIRRLAASATRAH